MKPISAFLPDDSTFKKPSLLVILLAACFAFWYVDLWKPYNTANHKNNFVWDVFGYYSYLPATFCNHGSFEWANTNYTNHNPVGPLNTHLPKYTYGMAVMYAPFFALGYWSALAQHLPADGFSDPFAACIRWGSVFYVLLGLFFLRRFLLAYFSEWITALVLATSLFGTTLFMYTYAQSEMTHGYLFCLFSAFLYFTDKWHRQPAFSSSMPLALVFGLIALVRPTEAFILFFFVFWNVRRPADLGPKARFFMANYKHLLIMVLVPVLLWIPQLLFYKQHTGQYFYFSYNKEGFFWSDPQIVNILFSYRKGWITYTPLIVLAFAGFFFIPRQFPLSRWFFVLVTALMVYVLSCWWDWGYGGSFGAREFCQHIAYLAVPLGYFFEAVFGTARRFALKGLLTLCTLLFLISGIFLNIGQTYQYQVMGVIHYAGMTKKMYWDVFRTYQFGESFNTNYQNNIKMPDFKSMEEGKKRDE